MALLLLGPTWRPPAHVVMIYSSALALRMLLEAMLGVLRWSLDRSPRLGLGLEV